MKLITKDILSQETRGKFIVPNPKFYLAQKQGRSTRWLKETTDLSYKGYYPHGALYLKKPYKDLSVAKEDTTITLKESQKPIFDNIKRKKGCLVYARTGYGKSVVITALTEV